MPWITSAQVHAVVGMAEPLRAPPSLPGPLHTQLSMLSCVRPPHSLALMHTQVSMLKLTSQERSIYQEIEKAGSTAREELALTELQAAQAAAVAEAQSPVPASAPCFLAHSRTHPASPCASLAPCCRMH